MTETAQDVPAPPAERPVAELFVVYPMTHVTPAHPLGPGTVGVHIGTHWWAGSAVVAAYPDLFSAEPRYGMLALEHEYDLIPGYRVPPEQRGLSLRHSTTGPAERVVAFAMTDASPADPNGGGSIGVHRFTHWWSGSALVRAYPELFSDSPLYGMLALGHEYALIPGFHVPPEEMAPSLAGQGVPVTDLGSTSGARGRRHNLRRDR